MRLQTARLLMVMLSIWIAGCTATPTPTPPATTAPSTAPPTTVPQPATETPTSTPDESNVPTTDLVAAVQATLPAGAFDGVNVLPLSVTPGSQPLWAIYTFGLRDALINPLPNHFVAIYTRESGDWKELARKDLESLPDYVDQNGPRQAQIDPARIWIEVAGGAGAHSGAFELLSFDGAALKTEVKGFNSSPDAGRLQDLNGDGVPEVILNASEPYVFCYACGVRFIAFGVLNWDAGQQRMVDITLQSLTADSPARAPNDRAVELAHAGLWKDALVQINQARALADQNATADATIVIWNQALIELHADAMAQAAAAGPYPLLSNIFYGDYAAAVDVMRAYAPQQIFTSQSPLIVGTPAEGWLLNLVQYITTSVDAALAAQSDIAGAYFLRGWAAYLNDPASAHALPDVTFASQLAPNDALFSDSAAYLAGLQAGQPQRIVFAPGSVSASVQGSVNAGETRDFVLRALAGQTMSVNIVSPNNDVLLTIYGVDDGQVLVRYVAGASSWSGTLSLTQDYGIQAVSVGATTTFSLEVTIQ